MNENKIENERHFAIRRPPKKSICDNKTKKTIVTSFGLWLEHGIYKFNVYNCIDCCREFFFAIYPIQSVWIWRALAHRKKIYKSFYSLIEFSFRLASHSRAHARHSRKMSLRSAFNLVMLSWHSSLILDIFFPYPIVQTMKKKSVIYFNFYEPLFFLLLDVRIVWAVFTCAHKNLR